MNTPKYKQYTLEVIMWMEFLLSIPKTNIFTPGYFEDFGMYAMAGF